MEKLLTVCNVSTFPGTSAHTITRIIAIIIASTDTRGHITTGNKELLITRKDKLETNIVSVIAGSIYGAFQ